MKWSFTIEADNKTALIDQLNLAAKYVRAFPAMFEKSEVDTLFQISDEMDAARID